MSETPARILNSPSSRVQADYAMEQWAKEKAAAAAQSKSADEGYVATDLNAYKGEVVGNGECVDYIKENTPGLKGTRTSQWKPGPSIKDRLDSLKPGTAIGSFSEDGRWGNQSGTNHAAHFLSAEKDPQGNPISIRVRDQYRGQSVGERTIRFDNKNTPSNNAYRYSIIQLK